VPHQVPLQKITQTKEEKTKVILCLSDSSDDDVKPVPRRVHFHQTMTKVEKVKDLDLLSLSDSSDNVKPFAPFTTPSKSAALIIDLCSPDTKPAVTRSSVIEAPGVVPVGSTYSSLEAAQEAIYTHKKTAWVLFGVEVRGLNMVMVLGRK
jgi:hypothetical protein